MPRNHWKSLKNQSFWPRQKNTDTVIAKAGNVRKQANPTKRQHRAGVTGSRHGHGTELKQWKPLAKQMQARQPFQRLGVSNKKHLDTVIANPPKHWKRKQIGQNTHGQPWAQKHATWLPHMSKPWGIVGDTVPLMVNPLPN